MLENACLNLFDKRKDSQSLREAALIPFLSTNTAFGHYDCQVTSKKNHEVNSSKVIMIKKKEVFKNLVFWTIERIK